MQTLRGIDLSHWNTVTNYDAVAKNNSFVILKASEGNSSSDTTYQPRYHAFHARNVKVGAYHFARGTSGASEVTNFLHAIRGTRPSIIALDIEVVFPNTVDWCARFMSTVLTETGITPHLYINPSYLKRYVWDKIANKYPLWLAAYRPSIPKDIAPWDHVSIWQYTSTGKQPGVTGNVDCDTMYIKDETVARTTTGTIEVRDAWNPPVDKTLSPEDYDAKLFNYVSAMGRDVQTIKETLLKLSK